MYLIGTLSCGRLWIVPQPRVGWKQSSVCWTLMLPLTRWTKPRSVDKTNIYTGLMLNWLANVWLKYYWSLCHHTFGCSPLSKSMSLHHRLQTIYMSLLLYIYVISLQSTGSFISMLIHYRQLLDLHLYLCHFDTDSSWICVITPQASPKSVSLQTSPRLILCHYTTD